MRLIFNFLNYFIMTNFSKFRKVDDESMKNVKGGGRREVEYYDVDGDGRIDKVVTKYDNAGNRRWTKVKYG